MPGPQNSIKRSENNKITYDSEPDQVYYIGVEAT